MVRNYQEFWKYQADTSWLIRPATIEVGGQSSLNKVGTPGRLVGPPLAYIVFTTTSEVRLNKH